jgi:hypothetical protein
MNAQMFEDSDETPEAKNVANELIMSAEGVQVLIGLAAVTLGIEAVPEVDAARELGDIHEGMNF